MTEDYQARHKERVKKATEEYECPICRAFVGMHCDPLEPIGGTHIGRTMLVTIAEQKAAEAARIDCGDDSNWLFDEKAAQYVCKECGARFALMVNHLRSVHENQHIEDKG